MQGNQGLLAFMRHMGVEGQRVANHRAPRPVQHLHLTDDDGLSGDVGQHAHHVLRSLVRLLAQVQHRHHQGPHHVPSGAVCISRAWAKYNAGEAQARGSAGASVNWPRSESSALTGASGTAAMRLMAGGKVETLHARVSVGGCSRRRAAMAFVAPAQKSSSAELERTGVKRPECFQLLLDGAAEVDSGIILACDAWQQSPPRQGRRKHCSSN